MGHEQLTKKTRSARRRARSSDLRARAAREVRAMPEDVMRLLAELYGKRNPGVRFEPVREG